MTNHTIRLVKRLHGRRELIEQSKQEKQKKKEEEEEEDVLGWIPGMN